VTTFFSALSTGAIYTLLALGFNVVFVSAGMFNFAQAQFMMVGTFISYWVAVQLHLPEQPGSHLQGYEELHLHLRVLRRPVQSRQQMRDAMRECGRRAIDRRLLLPRFASEFMRGVLSERNEAG